MTEKLSSIQGKQRIADRSCIVEHVFGEIKEIFKFRRFIYRSLQKVKLMWNIVCIAYNFRKLARLAYGYWDIKAKGRVKYEFVSLTTTSMMINWRCRGQRLLKIWKINFLESRAHFKKSFSTGSEHTWFRCFAPSQIRLSANFGYTQSVSSHLKILIHS